MTSPWKSLTHRAFVTSFLTLPLIASNAFGWGSTGHALIGEVASEIAPAGKDFWFANSDSIGILSNVPDTHWKKSGTMAREESNHWFHIDAYIDPSTFLPEIFLNYLATTQQYSQAHVKENGTSSWRSEQMYLLAVTAMRKRDYKSGLEIIGALSHYIGDMSQPLHLTMNYDGQMSGQRGIHKYFETTILQKTNSQELRFKVTQKARALLASNVFLNDLENQEEIKISYLEGMRAISELNQVLSIDKDYGRGSSGEQKQLDIAIDRLADGAATLAYLFGRIAVDAQLQNRPYEVKTSIPKWIPSEFQGTPALGTPSSLPTLSTFPDCF